MACWTGELNFAVLCVVFVTSIQVVSSQKGCAGSGNCLPAPQSLSKEYLVTASPNATCGDPSEVFCLEGDCTKVCNANDKDLMHPTNYTQDPFSPVTYWKSKNYIYPVFLQIDTGATFMLYRSVVTFFHELPAAMYFAKSNDFGATFTEIAYYSTDCQSFFNRTETAENKRNGLEVQCFKIDPGTNTDKQISYEPMRDDDTATAIKETVETRRYFLMTNIRLMLDKFKIDANFNPSPLLQRSYYFTVSDWLVGAACFCNGQASECDAQDFSKCVCEKNTAGSNCSSCLDLYNNRPYQVGQACEACGCNGHAASCHYNTSLNYGVCDNCSDNTMGHKCEECKPYFYRNSEVAINHTNTCLDCACNISGVVGQNLLCNQTGGQCPCKPQVMGRTCGRCRDGYWNLQQINQEGCQECGCMNAGTVNASSLCHQSTGQCFCKPTLTGRMCDRCKEGYFGLTGNNPRGCTECNCDLAGSLNSSCNANGECYCRPKFSGHKCENIQPGFYIPGVQQLTFEAEEMTLSEDQQNNINYSLVMDDAGDQVLFMGVKLYEAQIASSPTNLTFTATVPATGPYTVVLRFMTHSDWSLIKLVALLRSLFQPYSCDGVVHSTNEPQVLLANVSAGSEAISFGSACLLEGEYAFRLEIPLGSGSLGSQSEITVDSLVLLPTISEFDEYKMAPVATQQNMTRYFLAAYGLRTWSAIRESGDVALAPFYGRLYGDGQACACDAVGSADPSACEKYGGQCDCKPNVMGRTCTKCMPDFYNFTSGQGCQACACNVTGSTRSWCDVTTGQCSCHDGVTGRQCDACQRYFFGFHAPPRGCSPCNCSQAYSVDLQCDVSGVCPCKPGVGGDKCVACRDGFYNLTGSGCASCDCKLAGSSSNVCNKTSGQCPCKQNAVQRTCDACPARHYGLDANNPHGCLRCQCSNKSHHCASAAGFVSSAAGFVSSAVQTIVSPTNNHVNNDGWTAVDENGGAVTVIWDFDKLTGVMKVDTDSHAEVYYVAPQKFLGDKRFAYTYSLSFKLKQDDTDNPAESFKGDVILRGEWFDQLLVATLPRKPGKDLTSYKIKFVESSWHVGDANGSHPTSEELVRVLSNLASLRIRARWTTTNALKTFTYLADIKMALSNMTSVLPPAQVKMATNVENCTCPAEYVGLSCETCASGFTRATAFGGAYDTCVPCECNNHSAVCHPESGVCIDCQHNTTGDHCELCAEGLAGNATNGTPRDCIVCKDGYFGEPLKLNGKCERCVCSGNIDLDSSGNCNTTTGECLKCLHNTTGSRCEWCAPGYHGNALSQACTKCNCSDEGAVDNICNHVTGQCTCQPYVTGLTCGTCEQNAYNYTRAGCMPCNCDDDGSIDLQCHETYGNCSCKARVIGQKCDTCMADYYDVTSNCLGCDCLQNQTLANTSCHRVNGQCSCQISLAGGRYGGRRCDACGRHTVGDPPFCYPCEEQCYINWHGLIEDETEKVVILKENVTYLLNSFGQMEVDYINATLRELAVNVTRADQVFTNGSREDLKEKKEQIERIQNTIDDLQQKLNASQDTLDEAKEYLREEVTGFNGSIELVPTPADRPLPEVCVRPGAAAVLVDWACINAMAHAYRLSALAANSSGQRNYSSIESDYHSIKLANQTASTAARQIREAIAKLSSIGDRRAVVESKLGEHFRARLANNSATLTQINAVTNELLRLVERAQTLRSQARQNVSGAQAEIDAAADTVRMRKSEAHAALVSALGAEGNVSQAHEAARDADNVTTHFKENATAVLAEAESALENVTAGINRVAHVSNMTKEAEETAREVEGLTMPVSVQEIQTLVNEIKNTNVDEGLVNSTYQGAAEGLGTAQKVEALAQRASEQTESTLKQVEEIETAIREAGELRAETRNLQRDTDSMVAEINNITQSVNGRFSEASDVGNETLRLIHATVTNLNSSLQCFHNANETAMHAEQKGKDAYHLAAQAKQVFNDSERSLAQAETNVSAAYDEAKASFTEIEKAHNDSRELQADVSSAQALLQEYIEQRDELFALQQQVQALESQADDLLTKFERASQEYAQCDGSTP